MNKKILPIAIIALLIFSVALGDMSPRASNIFENQPKALGPDTEPYILSALILTIPIELVVAWVIQRLKLKEFNLKRLMESVLVVNLITVPILNLIVGYINIWTSFNEFIVLLVILEILVTAFEAYFIYYNNKTAIILRDSVILSIAMNSASFFGGLAIITILG